ncbi:MAG: protein kinase, partial [Arenicellales bacterium]
MSQDNLAGHTLGQYTVMERLGRGGMADVYKAFHPQLEVYRAIKVIRREFVTAPDFRVRFQKEAQAVATLRHPNIVQIHDFGEQDEAYYMVMEFIQGRDLKRIIQEEGRIRPISRAVDIVDQVAGALHYAHSQGLIHRDIKPENIMITDDGLPILTDFGIAKLLTSSTQLTQTGLGIGTPAYMSPEQAKALPEIGPQTDIYSLSVVLYEMLTGRVPYSADTPMAVMLKAISDPMPMPRSFSSDISESLQQVLVKGLAKEANDRYATARQLQEALHRAVADEPPPTDAAATEIISSPPPTDSGHTGEGTPARRTGTTRTRYPLYVLATLAVLAVIAIALFLVLKSGPGKVTESPPAQKTAEATKAAESPSGAKGAAAQKETAVASAKSSGATSAAGGSQVSVKLVEQKTATEAGKPLKFPMDLKPGDVVYLQVYKTSETTDFTLDSADGHTRVFRNTDSHGPVTLEAGGHYVLSVLTRDNKTANVDFVLWLLRPPVIDGGKLEFGKYTKGHTSVAGQTVSYTLDAKVGQTIYFDFDKASASTRFILMAPDGRTRVFSDYDDHGPVALKRAGTYNLIADPNGDATSDFEFTLWNVDPPVVDGGKLEFGKYTKGHTSVAGQIVSYTLDAKAGQTIYFDFDKASASTKFVLMAPDGRTRIFSDYDDHGPVALNQSGAYNLIADPNGNATSDFEFTVWNVDPPVVDGGKLEFGKYTKGHTSVAGQTVSYTLDAKAGQTIYFDFDKASASTKFVLMAPDGRTRVFSDYDDHGPVALNQSGAYNLIADPNGNATSDFEFTVWNVDP